MTQRWVRTAQRASIRIAPTPATRPLATSHQRHDWHAQGGHPCARRRADPLHDRQICAGLPPRRHLLVHCRPRLGDRDVVRHHRPLTHGVTNIVDEADFDAAR
jgi:hypothetical protein